MNSIKKVLYPIISLVLLYFLIISVIHRNYMEFALFSSALFLLLILFSHTEKMLTLSILFYTFAIIIVMQFNKLPIEFMLNLKISLRDNLPITNTIYCLVKFFALVMITTLSGIKIISFFSDKRTLRLVDMALSFNPISGMVSLVLVIDGTISSFHFKIIAFVLSILATISLSRIILKKNPTKVKMFGKTSCINVSNGLFFASGICWDGMIKGEKGLIIAHPLTKEVPSVFEIRLGNITDDVTGFSFKIANIADSLEPLGISPVSGDTKIVVLAIPSGESPILLDDFVISAGEGWITKKYDLTQFRGRLVDIYIYGFAGGKELWNGEWYGIGDFSLITS